MIKIFLSIFIIALMINQTILAKLSSKITAEETTEKKTITVVGRASYNVKTDRIQINLEITTKNMVAAVALSINTAQSNKAIGIIKNQRIEQDNITTTSYSLNPVYTSNYDSATSKYTRTFEGYEVRNGIQVLLDDLRKAGNLIDALVKGDVKTLEINSVNFLVSPKKIDDSQADLIEEAFLDADQKAQIILKQMNLTNKTIKRVQLGTSSQGVQPLRALAFDAAGSRAPTLLGNAQEIAMEVTVEYYVD